MQLVVKCESEVHTELQGDSHQYLQKIVYFLLYLFVKSF